MIKEYTRLYCGNSDYNFTNTFEYSRWAFQFWSRPKMVLSMEWSAQCHFSPSKSWDTCYRLCYRSLHNPCNTDWINFHIWKLILIQCDCNLSQIWKLTQCFSALQGLCKLLYHLYCKHWGADGAGYYFSDHLCQHAYSFWSTADFRKQKPRQLTCYHACTHVRSYQYHIIMWYKRYFLGFSILQVFCNPLYFCVCMTCWFSTL